jgi:hypothetical protein
MFCAYNPANKELFLNFWVVGIWLKMVVALLKIGDLFASLEGQVLSAKVSAPLLYESESCVQVLLEDRGRRRHANKPLISRLFV